MKVFFHLINYGNATITEVGIYGSSRIGVYKPNLETNSAPEAKAMPNLGYVAYYSSFYRGLKQFELTNHLGNVMATVTDTKIPVANNGNISYFKANVITATEYAPFGMQLQGRIYTATSSSNYRYGFNGKEMDNEVNGNGNQYDYGFRIYNPQIGKFLSVDPLSDKYPWYTPYQFAGNTPIQAIDIDGLEEYVVTNYYNRFNQLKEATINYITDKELNNNAINMQLVTSNGQKISPDSKVLVRNINSQGKLISYERKQSLNKRELNILNTGSKQSINEPPVNPFGINFTEGEFLTTESRSYTDDRYEGIEIFKQFHPAPPPPPILPGTIVKNFNGSNNYFVGVTPFEGAGKLGNELTSKLANCAQQLNHPDSKISVVTITVKQVIGSQTSQAEVTETKRQVNLAINNMIELLKKQTKGKNIKFVNGGANVVQTETPANKVPDVGTSITFDKSK